MANKTQPKNKKRQPAKKRLPLSAEKTSSKKKPKKPFNSKKTIPKLKNKKVSPKKKLANNSATNRKKSPKKIDKNRAVKAKVWQKQRRIITLPLTRRTRLVLAVSRIEKPPRPKSVNKKTANISGKKTSKLKERLISACFILAGIGGSVFFGLQSLNSSTPPLAADTATMPYKALNKPPKKTLLPPSPPVNLHIPDIQLKTSLRKVGLHQDGTLEVPDQYQLAGWYRHSPTPGEIGPSVIVGHLDNVHGPAAFGQLWKLLPGQIIEVKREDGKTARFTIEKIKQFSQSNFPTNEVYGNTAHPSLRLITCGGMFNKLSGRYSDNTVVFASLITPKPEKPKPIKVENLMSKTIKSDNSLVSLKNIITKSS